MNTAGRLTKVYDKADRICYHRGDKFIIMSDCHRGVGNIGDNFLKNRPIYMAALQYYYQKNYNYVELGDGDELWENKRMEDIRRIHGDVFELLAGFYRTGRLYMLYGNHDIQKKEMFPELKIREGMVLEECETKRRIFLVHGHQGDWLNDRLWPVGCFLVRHFWRHLELLGMENPISASESRKKKSKVEQHLADWANANKQLMIAGHTHRSNFAENQQEYYFNDGSCVAAGAITGIELEAAGIRLVKWCVKTRSDSSLYIGREVLREANLGDWDTE